MAAVPDLRIRTGNDRAVRAGGRYVLYWMIAARRRRSNFALQRAVELARELDKPLLVLEALRCGYRWASDRLHAFALQGMAHNRADFAGGAATYVPYVEPEPDAGKGLLAELAADACAVVTDDFPCFFLPRMVAAAAEQVDACAFELVDGNGLLPMRAADKVFARAFDFRRYLQKVLAFHLAEPPVADPLRGVELPALARPPAAFARWRPASDALLAAGPEVLAALPIDHGVAPVAHTPGGAGAALDRLRAFARDKLAGYDDDRNHPDRDGQSGLSPYLHFGHLGAHDVLRAVARVTGWTIDELRSRVDGKATGGWWGLPPSAEAFLDQLTTWRELGYNLCWQRDDYDRYESLPDWVQQTLAEHEGDPRDPCYDLGEFEAAATHDPLWNAAQRQLLRDGVIHNYLRMLWGKKILHWSASPREALAAMVELNNKYGLDGRNPNSYTGIFWTLGRYDRPWGPERPVFGRVRYMTSASAMAKIRLREYLERYAASGDPQRANG